VTCYVQLDGPDGGGKSTQAQALVEWLRAQGRTVLHVREPGSTPAGELLRQLLLSPATGELQPITEALLFSAARAELVHAQVRPALARGEIVVGERGYLSTVVYQALAGDGALDAAWVFDVTRRVHGDCLPDAVFVLDVSPATSAQRRAERSGDRIEARPADFHARVRDGFVRAIALDPRARRVDAERPFADVQQDLRAQLALLLR
jgi:dTMP kinase